MNKVTDNTQDQNDFYFGHNDEPRLANLLNRNTWILILILAVGVIVLLVARTAGPSWLDFSNEGSGNIGSYIGGVITPFLSLVTIMLIYLTYTSQRAELKQTSRTLGLQQFENAFFELLKVHRDNVAQVVYEDQRGRNAFVRFVQELQFIYDRLGESELDAGEIRNWDVIRKWQFVYILIFVGASENSWNTIRKYLDLQKEDIEIELKYFRKKQKEYGDEISRRKDEARRHRGGVVNMDYGEIHKTLFKIEGQRSNLGHYFRHLYRTVRFVDEHPIFRQKDPEKTHRKGYVKMLRAQLSDFELGVFFLGSLPVLGEKWEWRWAEQNPKWREKRDSETAKGEVKRRLITDYDLIRNLPMDLLRGVTPKDIYPHVRYASEN